MHMSIRVGFYGAGGIGCYHMDYLRQMPEVDLVAACDPMKPERGQRVQAQYGVTPYHSADDLLDQASIDVLYVCVPPHLHQGVEIKAARRGIHLFVEKPIELDLERARETERAIDEAGVITMVGYNWRYLDVTDQCRQLMENQTIGMVLGYWMGGLPGVQWWQTKQSSGGQIVEQATHVFDIARYLVGEVKAVHAYGDQRLLTDVPQLTVEDVATTCLQFANGAVGTISCTSALSSGYLVGLTLVLRDLVAELHLDVPGGLDYQHATPWLRTIQPFQRRAVQGQNDSYRREDEVFIDAVRTGNPQAIRSPYSDARKTLAVTLAAQRAVDSGSEQQIPL
jgi:predicted dehydrogenase